MAERTAKKPKLISARGKDIDLIAGGGGSGWDESWGQEVIDQKIVPRVGTNSRVADIASGAGRASMSLAMRGAKVISVDLNEQRLREGDDLREKADARPSKNVVADIRTLSKRQLGGGVDVVVASDALNHLNKTEADKVIDNLPRLLNGKRGGIIYVNAPSTDSSLFQNPEWCGGRRSGPKTVVVECDCSGELKEEPVPFYERGEIEARLARRGGNILSSRELVRNGDGVLHEVVALFKPRKKKI